MKGNKQQAAEQLRRRGCLRPLLRVRPIDVVDMVFVAEGGGDPTIPALVVCAAAGAARRNREPLRTLRSVNGQPCDAPAALRGAAACLLASVSTGR